MRKLNLNKKGFTLIELLAVIVILAIIIMLVFPQITNIMNSSKVSLIHSRAKELEKWWNTTTSADELMADSNNWTIPSDLRDFVTGDGVEVEGTKLGGIGNWVCIGDVKTDAHNLAEIMELTATEFNLKGNLPENGKEDNKDCSAIRYTSEDGIEIFLIAARGGRHYTDGKVTYAYSSATGGVSK